MKKVLSVLFITMMLSGCLTQTVSKENESTMNKTMPMEATPADKFTPIENDISDAEKEFNNSGQAKAVENSSELDLPVSNFELLQGKWVSIDDDKSVVEFDRKTKIEYYDGQEMDREQFAMYDHMTLGPNSTFNENGEYILMVPTQEMDYRILTLNDNVLEMSYIPRGNTLKYKRILEEY